MTRQQAKEIVRQILDDGIMTEEKAIQLINNHTLSIVEKVVGDEIDTCQYERETDEVRITCYSILTRTKNEIGE